MLGRRATLGAVVAMPFVPAARAEDDPSLAAAIRAEIGDRVPVRGGMTVRLPAVAEHGGQVPLAISVDSPMTAADHVVAIHVFATRNPTPGIASFRLTPAMGRADVQTRIRLAEAQTVIVLAEHADGRVTRGEARATVSQGGCLS